MKECIQVYASRVFPYTKWANSFQKNWPQVYWNKPISKQSQKFPHFTSKQRRKLPGISYSKPRQIFKHFLSGISKVVLNNWSPYPLVFPQVGISNFSNPDQITPSWAEALRDHLWDLLFQNRCIHNFPKLTPMGWRVTRNPQDLRLFQKINKIK